MNNQTYFGNTQPMYNRPQYSNNNFRGSPSMQAPYYNQFVPTSNKQFVDSLEHALSLPADYNSENVYFDKYKDVMYNICTNGRGEKSYTILYISTQNPMSNAAQVNTAVNMNQTNPDLYAVYDERLKKLEQTVEVLNGKYNAEQTNTKSE